jgi:hypothetical protein
MRIALFTGLLGLVFAIALFTGRAIDPDVGSGTEEPAHESGATAHGGSADGLALALVNTPGAARSREPLAFRVEVAGGEAVTDFDVAHDRRMHLIVVRRDLTGFRHLHPQLEAKGTWRAPVALDGAGEHRLFADFESGGEAHVLSADFEVPGGFEPRPLPPASNHADAGSGYEVRLAGSGDRLRFTVFRDGRRVDDIEPYLGARGHLVALREADLEYLHVHPESAATPGADIRFRVEYPSAARYRLFLQFKHDGEVHTAAFTRSTAGGDEHGDGRGH